MGSPSPADRAGHRILYAAHSGLSAVAAVSCDGWAVTPLCGPVQGTLVNDLALDSLQWTHFPAGLLGPESLSCSWGRLLGGWPCAVTCKGPMKMEQRFKDSALGALRTIKENTGPAGHVQLWAHTEPCWLRRSSSRCGLGTPRSPVTSSPGFPPVPAQNPCHDERRGRAPRGSSLACGCSQGWSQEPISDRAWTSRP